MDAGAGSTSASEWACERNLVGVATGTVREYIWLPEKQIAPVMAARAQVDRPLAVVDAVNTALPVTWWVHPDHLNRPVLMTDGSKAQVWQAVWKPFGEAQSITGPAALDTRFPGQWFQIESGLHYNWHRHYDPTTSRYTQSDPLGFVDGPGVYGTMILTMITTLQVQTVLTNAMQPDTSGATRHIMLVFALFVWRVRARIRWLQPAH